VTRIFSSFLTGHADRLGADPGADAEIRHIRREAFPPASSSRLATWPTARARPQGQRRVRGPSLPHPPSRLHGRRDEAAWWESVKLDPFILARHLWEHSRLNDAPSHGNISSSVSDVSTPSIPKEEVVQREPDSAGAVFSETADVVDIPQSGNCSGGRAGQSTQGEG
jgi:hypothetical protein